MADGILDFVPDVAPAGTTAPRQQRAKRHYLIKDVIPRNTVNLLGGPVDVGKSTLIFDLMTRYSRGDEVFGSRTAPVPVCYLIGDRGVADVHEMMDRLGIEDEPFPILEDSNDSTTIHDIPNLIPSNTKLLIIEALPIYVPSGRSLNDWGVVARWLREVRKMCVTRDLTIIGTLHTTKQRDGDAISSPQERFLGSVGWGGFADTKMLLERNVPSDLTDPGRVLHIMPKNRATKRIEFFIDQETGAFIEGNNRQAPRLNLWAALPTGTEFTRAFALETAEGLGLGISTATIDRYLATMVSTGELVKAGFGNYKRPAPELQALIRAE